MAFTDGERAILHALKAVSMQIMELEKRLESLGPGGALFQLSCDFFPRAPGL